ncbi:MAG: ABC transporter ATP-binding protein [Gemmatimonadota bacterium]
MADEGDILLEVRNLKAGFRSREGLLRAVNDVSFTVHRGRTLGVVGESGCGKSVTAQSILRRVPSTGVIAGGEVLLHGDGATVDLLKLEADGEEIRAIRGRVISMIFQEPMTSFSPVISIGDQIAEVIELHQGCDHAEARRWAAEILGRVGMPRPEQQLDSYPFSLSGGMCQRAMIAMALSCRPQLVIADEPTSALDVTTQAQILELLRRLQREDRLAVMIITHDLGVVAEMADEVLVMYLGDSVESGPVRRIFREPRHPYTRGLLASVPKLGSRSRERLVPIEGSVPSLLERPKGCPFHSRCPERIAGRCEVVEPTEVEVAPGHRVKCHLYGEGRATDA